MPFCVTSEYLRKERSETLQNKQIHSYVKKLSYFAVWIKDRFEFVIYVSHQFEILKCQMSNSERTLFVRVTYIFFYSNVRIDTKSKILFPRWP